jgi:hypothetical protein
MNPRIVDPNHFLLIGGFTDWMAVARTQGVQAGGFAATATHAAADSPKSQIVQLRWLTSKTLGYPTRPFTVWRRPAGLPKTASKASYQLSGFGFLGGTVITLDAPRVFVNFRVTTSVDTLIQAYAGAPGTSHRVGVATAAAGTPQISFAATAIQSIFLPPGVSLSGDITALDASVTDDPAWDQVETVGLPVDAAWAGIGGWGDPQGPVATPMDPRDAAYDRFTRGAPTIGWWPTLPNGTAAPPWQLADPKAMIELVHREMLDPLRQMVASLPPEHQSEFTVDFTLDAQGGTLPAVLHHRPLEALLYGVATDGLASLITGYGTAFPEQLFFDDRTSQVRTRYDYMVTATYDDGYVDIAGPVDFAAILYAPGPLGGVPAPAVMTTDLFGRTTPPGADEPWSAVIRVEWDALAQQLGLRVGAYAFARQSLTPAGGTDALMTHRPNDTALQPIGLGMPTIADTRRSATDTTYVVDAAATPNVVGYAVAHHDLFGQYSPWSMVSAIVQEPPVDIVTLTSARIDVTSAPTGGLCDATLSFEFAWDWAVRTPNQVQFAGRLYGQAKLDDPPADLSIPAGFASGLGVPGSPLTIAFAPDGTAVASSVSAGLVAIVRYLSADGRTVLGAPVQDPAPRRYKIEVTGYRLDFDAVSRQGIALWGRGREARAPQRVGDWSTHPIIASTADPRPPLITISHEFVQLTSLADQDGVHHAVLEWPAAPGATGYFVYSCAEAKFNRDHGLNPPDMAFTLEERLAALRTTFAADPGRRSFARLNSTAVAGTRMPITLPRGSKEIHLFVVLGISDGQIESPWPTARTAFDAWAAPQVVPPAPPQLEVTSVFDEGTGAYRASLRIKTAPGVTVTKIDLHRVRVPDAAVAVESMGPAIAQIAGTAGAFTVAPTVSTVRGEAQTIGTVRGLDDVAGSWKRVFYRAVAWSSNDSARGLYGGRSESSAVRMVVVPPKDPPVIEAAVFTPASPGSAAGTVDTTILAPLAETPLGPHRLRAEAVAWHPDGSSDILMQYPAPADLLADSGADRLDAVGDTPGPGLVWHGVPTPTVPGEPGRTPIHIDVPRVSVDDAVTVRLRVTDPLGRMTEKVVDVAAGVVIAPPDILNPDLFAIIGRGVELTFETSVPDTSPAGLPYVLHVIASGGIVFPPVPPQRFEMNFADIPPAHGASPASPIVRSTAGGHTLISAMLGSRVRAVSVVVEAPDGARATWRGTVRGA